MLLIFSRLDPRILRIAQDLRLTAQNCIPGDDDLLNGQIRRDHIHDLHHSLLHNSAQTSCTGLSFFCKLCYGAKRIVFSSSATVYGKPETVPIREDFPLSTTNPYGETKLMIERILKDACVARPALSVCVLRYFNPVGAHESGLIGEDPRGIPNNLLPYVAKVAAGQLPYLSVFGNDYPTHDGTGVRDYIHVVDLAKAHLKAIERAETVTGVEHFNIGTGVGYSVLDIVKAYEKATGITINYKITARRPGDIDECYANPTKAYEVLGWRAENNIEDMCRDSYNWQIKNPNGYES